MKIYHYNPETFEYIGESEADKSPLEPGVFLIPDYVVEIKPPKDVDGKITFWNGSAWEQKNMPKPELKPELKPEPTADEIIQQKIYDIEATITVRRLREAVLTDEGKAWLACRDSEIEALRNQL